MSETAQALATALDSNGMFDITMAKICDAFKPMIPEDLWDMFREGFLRLMDKEVIYGITVELYSTLYAEEELQQLLAFFSSGVGQRYLQLMPILGASLEAKLKPIIEAKTAEVIADIEKKLRGEL